MKSGVGPMRDGENITSDEVRMVEILSKQYSDMLSEPREDISVMHLNDLYQECLSLGSSSTRNLRIDSNFLSSISKQRTPFTIPCQWM